jgi:hypothetical protein
MSFNTYFRASSYLMLATGALALLASGGLSLVLGLGFAVVLVLAWNLEGSRWQIPERIGLGIVLLSLPLFYLDWRMSTGDGQERVGIAALAHLILFLSTIKLLQNKVDRDWVFLYLISFFEVLLAAGLSVSPLFLGTLGLYMLAALSTVIAFEIQKAQRSVKASETRLLVAPDATLFRRLTKRKARRTPVETRRLPVVSLVLLVLIGAVALPLFFIAPRFGGSAFARAGTGSTRVSGFSVNVTLGDIGKLQQNNAVVMRVRVENPSPDMNLRWRGIALDTFDGRSWKRSSDDSSTDGNKNFYQFDKVNNLHSLTTQTFFLEPVDTPVLFGAPRPIALQGALSYLRVDREGAIFTRPHQFDRITYKVISDTTTPDASALRADSGPYPLNYERYLEVPKQLDPRIARLAREVVSRSGALNRYDAARAIEQHLQSSQYRYSLDMKAGGADPLADFLFNVREGHCEYFATAMAVMLRTLGTATRVVNGFQRGEYNDAADVYTVTQRDAHSWVEVYFPETDAWVTFDPTPPDGRPVREATGLVSRLGKYAEAMELYWNQYVIGYDRQEQRSLATSLRNQMFSLREVMGEIMDGVKASIAELIRSVRSAGGFSGSSTSFVWLPLLAALALPALFMLLAYRVRRLGLRRGLKVWQRGEERASVVEFYERMIKILSARGMRREQNETPLEFALGTGLSEVLSITRAYNRVRYGVQPLSSREVAEIEHCLTRLEGNGSK